MQTTKLPWPADAVMIVAADAGQQRREFMEAVVRATCRDCGRQLAADAATIRTAELMPQRRGRPVDFFCVECCLRHDPQTITHLVDHRGKRPEDR